ncbi:hypothetical protein J1614_006553 [Plenodomus biglobosus]|nr:hypothetical protein J1614_006553 [Plenodomus biglobosus]
MARLVTTRSSYRCSETLQHIGITPIPHHIYQKAITTTTTTTDINSILNGQLRPPTTIQPNPTPPPQKQCPANTATLRPGPAGKTSKTSGHAIPSTKDGDRIVAAVRRCVRLERTAVMEGICHMVSAGLELGDV